VSPLTLFFFFKIVLALLGPLHFHMNFRINLLISERKKNLAWILTGIVLNL